MDTYTAASLPDGDNVNACAFSVALRERWFVRRGAMIAYYGTARFEGVLAASVQAFTASRFSSPVYAGQWMVADGGGKVVFADRGFDVNSFDLDAGNLTVKAGNLLGFSSGLSLKQSIVPGFLTLLGTGTFLASSNGPVVFVEPPFRADPEALLGWADCPAPSHHYDARWMASFGGALGAAFGRVSGEERQFDFTGAGTVLLQSSEVVREDPALLAQVEAQTQLLSPAQAGALGSRLTARAQQHAAQ